MHTPSPPGALVRELSRLFVRSQRAQSSCVDGASNVQCHVLTELLRVDELTGLTQQALVERLSLDKAWISRAVDALVSDGVVAKRPHEDDKRSVKLSLTALGRIRAEKLENTLNFHAAQVFEHIAVDQHAQIHDALAVLVAALTQAALNKTADDSAAEIKPTSHIDTLVFEHASMQDVPAIEALLTKAKLSIVGVRRHIAHFRLGKRQGKIVAVGGLEIYGEQALLRSIAVDADQRNKAYGKQIVRDVCHSAQRLGSRDVYLKTVSARPFFDALGFQVLAYEQIPESLKKSSQFRGACPASATLMHCVLKGSGNQ